jgi:hypothetical protein
LKLRLITQKVRLYTDIVYKNQQPTLHKEFILKINI